MAEYRKHHAEIQTLGLDIVAISVDHPEDSQALKQSEQLPFLLLCDPSKAAVQSFGLFNPKERGGIAYPATFVLDQDRRVRFRSLDRTVTRVDLDGLLGFLRAGLSSRPPASKPQWVLPSLSDWYRAIGNGMRQARRKN